MLRVSRRCFCAFCRSERWVYRKRHVSVIDAALSAFASALASFILFREIDPRALVFFAIGLGLAEVFIVFRWRLSIGCPHCGFDPVLYKRKPELAAERVKIHMDRRRAHPLAVFTGVPRLPQVRRKAKSRHDEAMR